MVDFYLDVASTTQHTGNVVHNRSSTCFEGKKSYDFTSVKAQLYESNQTQMKENEP